MAVARVNASRALAAIDDLRYVETNCPACGKAIERPGYAAGEVMPKASRSSRSGLHICSASCR